MILLRRTETTQIFKITVNITTYVRNGTQNLIHLSKKNTRKMINECKGDKYSVKYIVYNFFEW